MLYRPITLFGTALMLTPGLPFQVHLLGLEAAEMPLHPMGRYL
jgi:hypothetical protein